MRILSLVIILLSIVEGLNFMILVASCTVVVPCIDRVMDFTSNHFMVKIFYGNIQHFVD